MSEHIKEEDLGIILGQVKEKALRAGIPVETGCILIKVNKRAKSRLGCCKREKEVLKKPVYTIEISEFVLEMGEAKVTNVIAHELLHTCKGCMNHGSMWKQYCNIMNAAYGYEIRRVEERKNESDDEKKYKYIIKCVGCGAELGRYKKSALVAHPENYRCRRCGCKFEISENQTTSSR